MNYCSPPGSSPATEMRPLGESPRLRMKLFSYPRLTTKLSQMRLVLHQTWFLLFSWWVCEKLLNFFHGDRKSIQGLCFRQIHGQFSDRCPLKFFFPFHMICSFSFLHSWMHRTSTLNFLPADDCHVTRSASLPPI